MTENLNTRPELSIVMTVFNGESFVGEAVSSMLTQTYQDFELVIVDDGSTDRTPQVLSALEKRDHRIRVISQRNYGIARANNNACEVARGRYLARLDHDDISLPDRLRLQMDFLEKNPNAAVLGGAIEVIDSRGNAVYGVQYPTNHAQILRELPHRACFAHSAVTMRRDAFMAVGKYREQFAPGEDYDLWLRFSEQYQMANLSEIIIQHRIHTDSYSFLNVDEHAVSTLGARVSASARRGTGFDPLDRNNEITPRLLSDLSVPNIEIRKAMMSSNLRWSNAMLRLGKIEKGVKFFLMAFRNRVAESRNYRHEGDSGLQGPYYEWPDITLKLLAVIRRILIRPVEVVRIIFKIWRRGSTSTKISS